MSLTDKSPITVAIFSTDTEGNLLWPPMQKEEWDTYHDAWRWHHECFSDGCVWHTEVEHNVPAVKGWHGYGAPRSNKECGYMWKYDDGSACIMMALRDDGYPYFYVEYRRPLRFDRLYQENDPIKENDDE